LQSRCFLLVFNHSVVGQMPCLFHRVSPGVIHTRLTGGQV
jgi:hypothetical protein